MDEMTTKRRADMTDTVRLNEEIKRSGLKKGWIAAELGYPTMDFSEKSTMRANLRLEKSKACVSC